MTLTRELGRSVGRSVLLSKIPNAALNVYGAGAHALGRARSVVTHARQLATGSQALRMMSGRAAKPTTMVAGEFLHGPGDTRAAIAALSADFAAFQADLLHHAIESDDAAWALSDVVPVIAQWQTFADRVTASTLAPYVTKWSALESWREQLIRLREIARARKIELSSSGPIPLPQTVWERGTRGTGSQMDLVFALGKWIVYAAVGIVGLSGLYATLSHIRKEIA